MTAMTRSSDELRTCDECGCTYSLTWDGISQINGKTLCGWCWVDACERSITETADRVLAGLRGAA